MTACASWQFGLKPDEIIGWGEISHDSATPGYQLTEAEQALSRLQVWQLSGRLAVNSEQGVWTGALRWQQASQRFVLSINAPLGQGALQIKGDDIGVTLRTADGRSLVSEDIETLLHKEVGWELPIVGLRYWVLGLPQPKQRATLVRDADGKIRKIEQAQWQVLIQSYQATDAGELPRKLSIFNDQYRIRLVIHRWQ